MASKKYGVELMHTGNGTGTYREDIDPFVSIENLNNGKIAINNGYYDYEFPIETIISISIVEVK